MSNCPVCGKKVPPKNKIYCSQTCYSEYRQNYKTCIVCGKKFPDAKANPTKCCSPECSKIHRQSFSKVSQSLLDKKEEFWEQHQGPEHINAVELLLIVSYYLIPPFDVLIIYPK